MYICVLVLNVGISRSLQRQNMLDPDSTGATGMDAGNQTQGLQELYTLITTESRCLSSEN